MKFKFKLKVESKFKVKLNPILNFISIHSNSFYFRFWIQSNFKAHKQNQHKRQLHVFNSFNGKVNVKFKLKLESKFISISNFNFKLWVKLKIQVILNSNWNSIWKSSFKFKSNFWYKLQIYVAYTKINANFRIKPQVQISNQC